MCRRRCWSQFRYNQQTCRKRPSTYPIICVYECVQMHFPLIEQLSHAYMRPWRSKGLINFSPNPKQQNVVSVPVSPLVDLMMDHPQLSSTDRTTCTGRYVRTYGIYISKFCQFGFQTMHSRRFGQFNWTPANFASVRSVRCANFWLRDGGACGD